MVYPSATTTLYCYGGNKTDLFVPFILSLRSSFVSFPTPLLFSFFKGMNGTTLFHSSIFRSFNNKVTAAGGDIEARDAHSKVRVHFQHSLILP